jgi:hypothetical protein
MGEARKLAAILVADVICYSRLTGADEGERWRGCAPRNDLIDPALAAHNGPHRPARRGRHRRFPQRQHWRRTSIPATRLSGAELSRVPRQVATGRPGLSDPSMPSNRAAVASGARSSTSNLASWRHLMRYALFLSACLFSPQALADVTISPSYAQLAPGQSVTFTSNTPGVIWQVNHGNSAGITSTGSTTSVFTAPPTPPVPFTAYAPAAVTVTAINPANLSESATAVITLLQQPLAGKTYYVATNGVDEPQNGTLAAPFASLQYAASVAKPGDTVLVRGGAYNKLFTLKTANSGTLTAPITYAAYGAETPIIDGTKLTIPGGQNGLVTLDGVSDVIIEGFIIQNYTTTSVNDVPIGIYITGVSDSDQVINNHVTKITTTAPATARGCANNIASETSNALGIDAYGPVGTLENYITNFVLAGNLVDHLLTGCSESVSMTGNVSYYAILDNVVAYNNNIGIDSTGWEDDGKLYDFARYGIIRGNVVHDIHSEPNNPDYNYYGADGIYVDGGANIIIEQNQIYHVDYGLEIASETSGHYAVDVTARNNLIYGNTQVGVSIGGASPNTGGRANGNGGTQASKIVNNTLYDNDTQHTGTGEFQIQWYATSNIFENNIAYANSQCLLLSMTPRSVQPIPATLNNNVYYCEKGASQAQFVWQTHAITGFSRWTPMSGEDGLSTFGNPQFASVSAPNFDILSTSPAIGAGANLGSATIGTVDLAGNPRVGASGLVTVGAYQNPAP